MTEQEQRIAIAEACGWMALPDEPCWFVHIQSKRGCLSTNLPDYLNDLNAMHEAEKMLTNDKEGVYEAHIYLVCDVEPDTIFAADMRKVICATAPQRAEAFLKTLGKWKE